MTNTPAREGLPELPEADVLTCYFHRDTVAADRETCYDAGYRAAYIASQPTQGGGEWTPVSDRLPAEGVMALVYWLEDGEERYDFDAVEEGCWVRHAEHYENYLSVALPENSRGPSEQAPYTHWRVIEAPAALPRPQPEKGAKLLTDQRPRCCEKAVQVWEVCADCLAFNAAVRDAFTPPPPSDAAQGEHVRHMGGGLLAIYRGNEQVREIGVTPGWSFRDRDEFIARYNAAKAVRVDELIAKLSTDTHSVEIYSGRNHGGKNEWLVAVRDSRTDEANEYEGDTLLDALLAAHNGEGNG
jgi:hypothetical protein